MALFDIFKKRKKPEKRKKEIVKEVKKKAVQEGPKPEIKKQDKQPAKIALPKIKSNIPTNAFRVLKEPHVSEKAGDLIDYNQYVFKVFPQANKSEIKKAVEQLYGVNVEGVRVIKIGKKKRRMGRIQGWRKGYKKAIVRLKQGQKIEVMPR